MCKGSRRRIQAGLAAEGILVDQPRFMDLTECRGERREEEVQFRDTAIDRARGCSSYNNTACHIEI